MASRPSRRRRRSTRVLLASLLLAALAALVVLALAGGSQVVVRLAAVAGVGAGVVAARLVYLELADTRRLAAADRAAQAVAYQALSRARAEEHAARLGEAHRLAEQRREESLVLGAELRASRLAGQRAEAATALLADRVAQAEQRAAQALVRLGEAEVERDALAARRRTGRVAPGRRTA